MVKKVTKKKILQLSERVNQRITPMDMDEDVGVNAKQHQANAELLDKEDLQEVTNALIDAFASEETNLRPFLNLFGAACSNVHLPVHIQPGLSMKEQHQLIYSTFRHCTPNKTTSSIFSSLREYVQRLIDQRIVGTIPSIEMEDPCIPDTSQRKEGFLFLYYATLCITAYFEGLVTKNKQFSATHNPLLNDAAAIAIQLHQIIDSVDYDDASSTSKEVQMTHAAIIHLCELWWLNDGPDREQLIGNILPILVENALHLETSKIADLKRLWNIRSALSIIDWEDPESKPFLLLLLRCTSSPTCIKSTDGKRFLSYILSSTDLGNLPLQVHQSIRVQIPENKKSILLQYSDIYFGAWKQSTSAKSNEESQPNELEITVLSDLVYASIYSLKPSLIQAMYTVLSKFYDQKQSLDVSALLYRLYTPILWRAMVAPNPIVRMNAVSVLLHIFPLPPSTAGNSSTKVYSTLQLLLQDPDPRVRSTTTTVVSQILSLYWDGIPSQQIRQILNRIVSEHASDVTSSMVRVGAVNAITLLLDAPQSHAVLREVLPSIGNLIHDKVEKVRLAVVHMLLRIKKIPNIKYYHIVPVEHLTARFADEAKHHSPTNAVSIALTSLMVNSYFPEGSSDEESTKEPIRRALQFCTDEPEAAIVFYTNVSKFRSFHSIAQLAIQLMRCLHTSVQVQLKRYSKDSATLSKRRRRFGTVAEDSVEEEEGDMTPPLEVLATIAEIVCILWQSIEVQLQDYDEWNQFLLDEFSGPKLSTILTFYETKAQSIASPKDDDDDMELMKDDCHRICSSMLSCAARLPSRSVDGLVSYMVSSVTKLSSSEFYSEMDTRTITSYFALLCTWDMTGAVVSSFVMSIRNDLGDIAEGSILGSPVAVAADSKKRRSSSRAMKNKTADGVEEITIPHLPVEIALSIFDHILTGSDASSIAARNAILSSKASCENLFRALKDVTRCMERILSGRYQMELDESKVKNFISMFDLYGRFALHQEAFRKNDGPISFSEHAQHVLFWTSDNVLSALQRLTQIGLPTNDIVPPFSDPNLSLIQIEKSFADSTMLSPQSPNLMVRPRRRVNRNKTPDRLEEGVGIFDDTPGTSVAETADNRAVRRIIIGLLNSTCFLLSEWLATGGNMTETTSTISQAASEWFDIFANIPLASNRDAVVPMLDEILPPFFRLTGQLVLTSGNCTILKQVLTKLTNLSGCSDEVSDHLRKTLSNILMIQGQNSFANELVYAFLDASYEIVETKMASLKCELPESFDEIFSTPSLCFLRSSFYAIVLHQQACLLFANTLLERCTDHVKQDEHHRLAIFELKCLWLVLKDQRTYTQVAESVFEAVRQLENSVQKEDINQMIEEFVSIGTGNE